MGNIAQSELTRTGLLLLLFIVTTFNTQDI